MENNLTIGIIGLGYVGVSTAALFANDFKVIGFDINQERINSYKKGIDVTDEVGPTINQLGIDFTYNPKDLNAIDVFIVCVQTPGDKSGINTTYLQAAARTIEQNMKKGATVIFSSTVYPGFTESVLIPILLENGKVLNEDVFVGYAPERISPGDDMAQKDTTKVISATSKETLVIMDTVFSKAFKQTFAVSSIKVAEATKVLENTMRDVNIAVLNQFRDIFQDIPFHEVQEAMQTKWNALHFFSGLVGGHCIAVNPYYLNHAAQERNHEFSLIMEARKINEQFYEYFITKIKALHLKNKSILVKGITYKPNVPDTRTSQIIRIVDELRKQGYCVDVEDPVLFAKHSDLELVESNKVNVDAYDCIIYAVLHDAFKQDSVEALLNKNIYIVDIGGHYGRYRENPYYIE